MSKGKIRRRKDKEADDRRRQARRQRGEDRKAHFAAGGTVEQWRGRHDVRPLKKNKGSRADKKRAALKDQE